MGRVSRRITFFREIKFWEFIYLNYFCRKIIRKGKGKIIPYKNAIIDLEEHSKICVYEKDIYIGTDRLKKSKTETFLRLRQGAVWEAKGGCDISYGVTIEILNNAVLYSEYFTMNSFSTLVAAKHIVLGNDVMIARNAIIFDSDFHAIEYLGENTKHSEDVMIGDHVWVGVNSVILKGVTVNEGSIIAADTVVMKDVESNVMVGNERKICLLKDNVKWSR